jgi:hypothetical protein
LPLAVLAYVVKDCEHGLVLAWAFPTTISSLTRSRLTPIGVHNPVFEPAIWRMGAGSPESVRRKKRSSPAAAVPNRLFATTSSSWR